MAQTLQQQESRDSSSNSENKSSNSNQQQQQSHPSATSSGAKIATRAVAPSKLATTDSASSVPTPGSHECNLHNNPPVPIFNRHQPSKIFITKCRTELEALLNSVKDKYHEEIKALNNNNVNETLHPDLFVQIGEEFKKPLHKCVIASRAFKLYNALKAFELVEVPVEEDIIISEFQGKENISDNNVALEVKEESKSRTGTPEVSLENRVPEGVAILHCHLPDNLISPELLLNFVRRVYLNQDIAEEEVKLYRTLIDWLKINKPELIKTSKNRNTPDSRSSFRTIQPLFEETPVFKSPAMSTDQDLLNQNEDLESNVESSVDELDETSQATSVKDESMTSSLTRTETFELITRNNLDSPSAALTAANKNGAAEHDDDQDDEDKTETSFDISNTNGSNTPTPYAPTTRTGLKPKTFTTPTNLRSTPRNAKAQSNNSIKTVTSPIGQLSKSGVREECSRSRVHGSSPTKANLSKQAPTAAKRSSISSNQPETTTPDVIPAAKLVGKAKSPAAAITTSNKGKLTSIARAHPISLERSQSPSTNVMNKSSGKNFIAANKRLVSQLEKKSAQNDTSVYESETENSDNGYFGLEPLTSDNLVAHMEKFTLISYSKLADALSRLFIDEIMPDTVILIKEDKQINAHKCILAARSAYLAEVIGKQSLPNSELGSSNEIQKLKIDLTEYSYSAVYFSMMHIYSGIVKVPDDLDLEELTKLTNQLHVITLRQVCMHNLRMNYCHYFHKPCNVCCVGVLKTLPLAWRYDYTELYSKCLQWIGSHFAQIFCLKEFSELKPHDLVEECYSATLSQLTPDNIIPKTIECQKLLKNLPRVKWTESIICLVGRQLQDFCHYVADNYEKILQSESFLNLGKNCWECEVLEENLLAAMNHLKPDSGCKTLIQLHKIECSNESYCEDPRNVSDSFANLVTKMRKYCERYLLKEAAAVVHCSSWRHMNPSLQKRIKDQAIISTDFDEPTKQLAAKPKLSTSSRLAGNTQRQSTSPSQLNNNSIDGTRSPSNRSTPESRLKSPSTTYLPPPKSKPAAARHVKVLK